MKFLIKGKKGTEYTEFEQEAQDMGAAIREASTKGIEVIIAKPIEEKVSFFKKLKNSKGGKVSMQDRIMFAKNLGTMLDAGLSLNKALRVIERQAKKKEMKQIATALVDDLAQGKPLHESLKAFPHVFSDLFVAMVAAGEESGSLASSLQVLAIQLEGSYNLTRKVKGAMVYPGVIISVMILIGILMMVMVVPTLSKTFTDIGAELPFTTKIVIGISNFMKDHFIITFGILIAALVSGIAFIRSKTGRYVVDVVVLRLPVIKDIVIELNSARTARTISSLLRAGVDLIEVLRITEDVLQHHAYKAVMKEAQTVVEKGEPLSGVFEKHEKLYPAFVSEMTHVGEETGKVADLLQNLAVFYENNVDQKTKDLSTIIEPVLMVLIGVVVGFFAISMITPMYSILNKI